MRAALVLLLAGAALATAQAQPSRDALIAVQQDFNARIQKFSTDFPMELLSAAQGVYLAGYGAVFTAQVDLIMTPGITPWHMEVKKEEIVKVHVQKLARLPQLKAQMREVLTAAASVLSAVPENENLVLAVSLIRFTWEDGTGLPLQIVMQAPRQKLLKRPIAEDAIQTREL